MSYNGVVYAGDLDHDAWDLKVLRQDIEDVCKTIGYATPEDYGSMFILRDRHGTIISVYAAETLQPGHRTMLDELVEGGRATFYREEVTHDTDRDHRS